MRHIDDFVNAYARGQLEGGNVARFGEGIGDGHRALVVVLVVVRDVTAETDRPIDDDVGGLDAVFDGGGVDVGLEAGAGLPFSLRGAVEDGERVVASADHGENVAAGVVHGQQRALGAGVLLERGAARAAFSGRGETDINDVAGFGEASP